MKLRIITLFAIFGLILPAYSQSVTYTYDEAGNRTIKSSATHTRRSVAAKDSVGSDSFSLKQKNDDLSIIGVGENSRYEIRIYNVEGTLMESMTTDSGYKRVSLKNYATGTYVIRLKGKKETKSYTIVKK